MRRAFSTTDLSINSKQVEHELKLIHQKIALAEQSYSNLIKDFTNLTVDLNRVQTRKQELFDTLSSMAVQESPTVQKSLDTISKCILNVSNSLSVHIQSVQCKVVQPISTSMLAIKSTREDLYKCSSAKTKQAITTNKLNKNMKLKKSKKQKKAELVLQNELLQITKQVTVLEHEIEEFEKSKVDSMKVWLQYYIHSCLSYHVKAVEEYTKAYQAIHVIDTEKHLQYFDEILFPPQQKERVQFVRWNSFSSLQ